MTCPTFSGIPAEALPDWWPLLSPMIAAACARSGGKYRAVDILRALIAREMQLWAALDPGEQSANSVAAICLTEIVNFPGKRVCRILAGTGERRERWVHFAEEIGDWARLQGCAAIEAVARPGWERDFAALGYRKTHVILEKSL
jgi:hypothetical protein